MKANAANFGETKLVSNDGHAITLLKKPTHKSWRFEAVEQPFIPATSAAYLQLARRGRGVGASERAVIVKSRKNWRLAEV
jgi:hypothetical protein